MLQPPHDLVPLIGSGSKFPPLKFHCCSGCIRHLRRCAGDHHHQYFLVNIDRCYFVRHVRLSGGEVADRASTFKYAPLRAIALPRGKATLNYWSTSAIRIKLPDGLRFSRALTTSATLSAGSIILATRASFHHLWWRAAPSQTPFQSRAQPAKRYSNSSRRCFSSAFTKSPTSCERERSAISSASGVSTITKSWTPTSATSLPCASTYLPELD